MLRRSHPKVARNSRARTARLKTGRSAKQNSGKPKSDELSLVDSIAAAASRDFAARATHAGEDEADLVNAVARAAGSYLTSRVIEIPFSP